MSVAAQELPMLNENVRGYATVRYLALARLAGGKSVTRGDFARDVNALIAHKLSPAEFRDLCEKVLADLETESLITNKRGRLALTEAGWQLAFDELGARKTPADWVEVRDTLLIAKALDLGRLSARQLKSILRPDGLRGTLLISHFGLRLAIGASAARVRAKLAVVALERAFGNKIKGSVDSRTGMSAKMSRMLAAQLLRRPRELGTDSRLLAALAAEVVEATRPSIDAIRTALLRRLVNRLIGDDAAERAPAGQTDDSNQKDAKPAVKRPRRGKRRRPDTGLPPRPAAANRPDLKGFVSEVYKAAAPHAEGWPGNRKTFICRVWQEVAARFPEWGLSEIEFKSMLAEAHRIGALVLAHADLRNKRDLAELQASAIPYKNMVWHYVRLPN